MVQASLRQMNAEGTEHTCAKLEQAGLVLARRVRANFWPDCAIPDTSMKFGIVVDHD